MKPIAALIGATWWAAPAAWAQADTAGSQSRPPRAGSAFIMPLASFLVPGFGQYAEGSTLAGAAYSGTAIAGYALYVTGDRDAASATDLPRSAEGQRAFVGAIVAQASGSLSAYDAFHRSLPRLRQAGTYEFVTAHDRPSSLLLAPFDVRMLGRWTTWIDLAQTAAITVIAVLIETEPGQRYLPFRTRDGVFVGSFSYGAGVGEEALFRGWLYPVLHESLGRRAWLSNGVQAALFGALHLPQAGPYALYIASWAFYEGWLTRRNGWSIRESIFHHFWYDVAVGAAALLTQKAGPVAIAFPSIQF